MNRRLTRNQRRRANRIEGYLVEIGIYQDNPWARIHAWLSAADLVRNGWGIRRLRQLTVGQVCGAIMLGRAIEGPRD